jgi:molybdopterin-containing oxidoreductase family iron-sulfur binding subunit
LVSVFKIKNAQLLVLAVNQILADEYLWDKTNKKGSNEKVAQLIEDMKAGSVHTLIMSGVNPVYTLADTASLLKV